MLLCFIIIMEYTTYNIDSIKVIQTFSQLKHCNNAKGKQKGLNSDKKSHIL